MTADVLSRLTPTTVLSRVPNVVLDVDTSNTCKVLLEGKIYSLGHWAIGLLDVFHRPRSVSEGVEVLRARHGGNASTRDLMSDLVGLVQAGVLATEPVVGFSYRAWPEGGYDAAYVHLKILNDRVRKGKFVEAVRETVRPGDVVLDLGSGSGILTVAAVQAGAAKVYAVEPSGMIGLSERVAKANGVSDKVEFIRDWSTRITLPERANVLTTDLVGNDPLDMKIWETVDDARQRLLTEDARILPRSFAAYARFYRAPEEFLAMHRGQDEDVARWKDWYGIDFGPLVVEDDRAWIGTYERPELVQTWQSASESVFLYECRLSDGVRRIESVSEPVEVAAGANCVVVYYSAALSENVEFSTDPVAGGVSSHWYTAAWVAGPRAFDLNGGRSRVHYSYRGDGTSALRVEND